MSQKKLPKDVVNIQKPLIKAPRILLHICCAPCSTYSIDLLRSEGWKVTGYFYNPNIYPFEEFEIRLDAAKQYSEKVRISLEIGGHDNDQWEVAIKEYAHLGEGSRRCRECISFRLENCARLAADLKFDAFTTTLTISPHKNSKTIFEIGGEMGERYGVRFEPYNFKKKDGLKKSIFICREHGIQRQDYCGCRYSLKEKEKVRKERPPKNS
jgi:predicted adenine nucleotide alpha hydrolase (AANH) superfamily ATPase